MTTVSGIKPHTTDRALLGKAVVNAGKAMGLTQADVAEIVGRNRSGLIRDGIDPSSKAGELALLLIRLYRSVYALVGGDEDAMQHWLNTENRYFSDVPRELVRSAEGLVRVLYYLDAMRGKI
ncbi:MbcA/ParS/Xre antitoxin family protein [uncultured Marinobacter sp.]|uniref:MbcA/ParS/Xre antitoxin family protein n=1 Tax=uncultured Marinobacter sp. TaxID=187379 RepID=UPI00260ED88C|nr:MbcA/ParS/Xre antitoxin family protein [uncultured Marinobacter sp.]